MLQQLPLYIRRWEKKTTILYLLSVIFSSLGFAFLLDLFSSELAIQKHVKLHMASTNYIGMTSSIILLAVIGFAFFYKEKKKVLSGGNIKEIKVSGMKCSHCASCVKNELMECVGVKSVEIDLEKKIVRVEGEITENLLQEKIEGLGYKILE